MLSSWSCVIARILISIFSFNGSEMVESMTAGSTIAGSRIAESNMEDDERTELFDELRLDE